MEKNFELVEKLVNTFGVSYEKAKEALEASNWDAVDVAIYLEKDKYAGTQEQEQVNHNPKGSFNIPVDEMKERSRLQFLQDLLGLPLTEHLRGEKELR